MYQTRLGNLDLPAVMTGSYFLFLFLPLEEIKLCALWNVMCL